MFGVQCFLEAFWLARMNGQRNLANGATRNDVAMGVLHAGLH